MRDGHNAADLSGPALSVGLVPLPHFTLLPFAGFVDTLRLAADEGDLSRPRACRWTILAPELKPVPSSCGAAIMPWEALGDPARFDHVVVVGGLLHRGTTRLDPRIAAFLRDAQRQRVGVIGICTGSFALAEAGLFRPGRRVCVSWYHYQDLVERHPQLRPVADRLWLREGRIITCAGGAAAMDLAASLVQAALGTAVAQKSLHIMLVDRPRPEAAAQPQPPNTLTVTNPRVRRAMMLIEQNLAAPLRADAIASHVAISKRQLERLFRVELGASVQTFARDLRLSYAVWQMAHSAEQITGIALACGFADPAHFNRHFRAAFGRPPSIARRGGPAALRAMLEAWWPYAARAEAAFHGARPGSLALANRRPYA
jgi:transcriptional regulator GlxA family with amidase domain